MQDLKSKITFKTIFLKFIDLFEFLFDQISFLWYIFCFEYFFLSLIYLSTGNIVKNIKNSKHLIV